MGCVSSSTSGNRFLSTYVKGFVDVSGGNVLLRAGPTNNNHLILQGGDISLNGRLFVTKDASLNGNVSLGGNLLVNGNLSVNQFQSTTKITTTNYQLVVAEDLSLNGRLNVTQDASLNGNVYVKGNVLVAGGITPTYTTPSFGPGQVGYVGYVNNSGYNTSTNQTAITLSSLLPGVYIVRWSFVFAPGATASASSYGETWITDTIGSSSDGGRDLNTMIFSLGTNYTGSCLMNMIAPTIVKNYYIVLTLTNYTPHATYGYQARSTYVRVA